MDITVIVFLALVAFIIRLLMINKSPEDIYKEQENSLKIKNMEVDLEDKIYWNNAKRIEYNEDRPYRLALQLLDIQERRLNLEAKKNSLILANIALLDSHEIEMLRLEMNRRYSLSEWEMRKYQIDKEYSIKELEQRNITIGHYVALAKSKNKNKQDLVLGKIKAIKKFAESQTKSMEYMDASDARQFKKNFLNNIDNNLDTISRDLNSPW